MGLVYRIRPKPPPPQALLHSSPDNSKILSCLVKCVESSKEYLDMFLDISTSDYYSLPIFEWFRIVFATFLIYRMSIGIVAISEWSPLLARETIDLEEYLSVIENRVASVETRLPSNSSHSDSLFLMFSKLINSVKSSFVFARSQPDPPELMKRAGPHFEALNNPSGGCIPQQYRPGCPAFHLFKKSKFSNEISSEDDKLARDKIATELQSIENERLWSEMLHSGHST
jgi:hypothetical protein